MSRSTNSAKRKRMRINSPKGPTPNRIIRPIERAWKRKTMTRRIRMILMPVWQTAEMRKMARCTPKRTKRLPGGHPKMRNKITDRTMRIMMIMKTRRAALQALNKRDNISSSL